MSLFSLPGERTVDDVLVLHLFLPNIFLIFGGKLLASRPVRQMSLLYIPGGGRWCSHAPSLRGCGSPSLCPPWRRRAGCCPTVSSWCTWPRTPFYKKEENMSSTAIKKVCFEKCVKFAVTDSSLVPLFEIRPNFVCVKWPVIRGDSYGRISPSAEVIISTGSLQRSGQWKMRTPYSRAVNGKCGLTTAERSTENTDSLQRLYTYILYTGASRVKK